MTVLDYTHFLHWIDSNGFVQGENKTWTKQSWNGKTLQLSFYALAYKYVKTISAQEKVEVTLKRFEDVGTIVSRYYSIDSKMLNINNRIHTGVLIRYVTYHILSTLFYHRKLVYVLADYSKRSRTTVIYGFKTVKRWLDVDKQLQKEIKDITTLVINYLEMEKDKKLNKVKRPNLQTLKPDLQYADAIYKCKWCDKEITTEQFFVQNEFCNKCYKDFLDEFIEEES